MGKVERPVGVVAPSLKANSSDEYCCSETVFNLVIQEVELDLLQVGCCGGCLRVQEIEFSYWRSQLKYLYLCVDVFI